MSTFMFMTNTKRYLGQTSTTWRRAGNRVAVLVGAAIALAAIGHTQAEPATTDAAPTPMAATADTSTAGLGAGIGCWTEWNADGTSENLYGDQALAPAGSTPLDCEAFTEPADSSDETTAAQPSTDAEASPAAAEVAAQQAEDGPGFDCRTSGNRTCGPTNADGVAPGCYVNGQLDTPWSPEMYGAWANCGPVNAYDSEQQARLDGKVGQVCLPNEQGGFTCDWADEAPEVMAH